MLPFRSVCIGQVLTFPEWGIGYSFIEEGDEDSGSIFGKDGSKDDGPAIHDLS